MSGTSTGYRTLARVSTFGDAGTATLAREPLSGRGCAVRVTHASVGSTDVTARHGDYLLHPVTRFVPGYDLVGLLETVDDAGRARGLVEGQRVTAVLPSMGAHATAVRVPSSVLVPVPDALPSTVAASMPLDAVTARHALDLLTPGASTLLVQGVSGAVGLLVAQLALAEGMRVFGTASSRTGALASRHGVHVLDYHQRGWVDDLLALTGGVDGVVDHTGSKASRAAAKRSGRVVRTAFGGRPGRQRGATAIGATRTLLRRHAHPSERICSVPALVATRRARYRLMLADLLELAAAGRLEPLPSLVVPFVDLTEALRLAEAGTPGRKVVLAMV
jgi:NADPH:quinone reductase-like Zn-dependent oxidoreductase